jgi:PAS domain S-box-containing protein
VEIIIWLLLGLYRRGFTVNRWVGVMLSLATAAFILIVLVRSLDYIPVLYSESSITKAKHYADFLLSFIAIAILLIYAAKFRNAVDERKKTIYEYIVIGICFFIPSRICFALSWNVEKPIYFLAHLFKLAYYFSIYYGVYKVTIEYPYKQVRKVKDFYGELLDNMPFGVLTYNSEGKVNYANRQCDSLFGYDMRKIYGTTIEQFLNSITLLNLAKADLLEKLHKYQGEAVTFFGVPNYKQGSTGKLIFTIMKLELGIVVEVRDARKAQILENMQLQTQTLLNSIDNPVFLLDTNRKVAMCNKKFLEITNTKSSDIVGLGIMELFRFFKAKRNGVVKKKLNNGKLLRDNTWSIQRLNGDIKKISLESSPIYNMDNEKIGWIVIGRDVSEYEKEQEKIIHSEKMAIIGQMAAGLVHEIKNPLASIKGLCQLMSSRAKPEKIQEYAAVMEEAVDDIGEIVTGFLQFSRPTSGNFEETSINSLVISMEIIISSNAYKHGIKTWFHYSETEKPVILRSQQIKNAILGMVDNALDAMNGAIDPKLIISTEHDKNNNMMRVSIKDNGIGITEEQLECIGTPFYTTKPRGTGLGVSVIKHIINEHRGTLKIESKFGEGTVFTISLPCKEAD